MTFVKVNPRRRRQHARKANFWASQFDNLMNELANGATAADATSRPKGRNYPAANVRELEDSFVLDLAIPGLTKKDITINVDKDQLTIAAEKTVETKEAEKVTRREFDYNNFKRSFTLPETVNTQDIKASFKNGVLTIAIAKKEEAKEQPARTITIK